MCRFMLIDIMEIAALFFSTGLDLILCFSEENKEDS